MFMWYGERNTILTNSRFFLLLYSIFLISNFCFWYIALSLFPTSPWIIHLGTRGKSKSESVETSKNRLWQRVSCDCEWVKHILKSQQDCSQFAADLNLLGLNYWNYFRTISGLVLIRFFGQIKWNMSNTNLLIYKQRRRWVLADGNEKSIKKFEICNSMISSAYNKNSRLVLLCLS